MKIGKGKGIFSSSDFEKPKKHNFAAWFVRCFTPDVSIALFSLKGKCRFYHLQSYGSVEKVRRNFFVINKQNSTWGLDNHWPFNPQLQDFRENENSGGSLRTITLIRTKSVQGSSLGSQNHIPPEIMGEKELLYNLILTLNTKETHGKTWYFVWKLMRLWCGKTKANLLGLYPAKPTQTDFKFMTFFSTRKNYKTKDLLVLQPP